MLLKILCLFILKITQKINVNKKNAITHENENEGNME